MKLTDVFGTRRMPKIIEIIRKQSGRNVREQT